MSDVQRVCAQCGKANPLAARYCAACGYDFEAALPAPRTSLPVLVGRAALPVLAGAASLALRAGWKLLQQRWAQANTPAVPDAARPVQPPAQTASQVPAVRRETLAARRPRRVIHIRSSWAVGDANGVWRQGHSEHTIEFDD